MKAQPIAARKSDPHPKSKLWELKRRRTNEEIQNYNKTRPKMKTNILRDRRRQRSTTTLLIYKQKTKHEMNLMNENGIFSNALRRLGRGFALALN